VDAFTKWFLSARSGFAGRSPAVAHGLIHLGTDTKFRTRTLAKLQADGAWATVLREDDEVCVVPLFPWQKKAHDVLYCNAKSLATHALVTSTAAAANAPDTQKCFVFMLALELG
jgi:hypothetical protein